MDLRIGLCVRTNLGNIGRIEKEYTFENGSVHYPEPQEWVLDNGYVLNEALMYAAEEEILNVGDDILDLIEPMDLLYVDIDGGFAGGIVVPRIPETQHELDEFKKSFKEGKLILKGIVPKELWINNMYEVK